jgi:hypothetical protein
MIGTGGVGTTIAAGPASQQQSPQVECHFYVDGQEIQRFIRKEIKQNNRELGRALGAQRR